MHKFPMMSLASHYCVNKIVSKNRPLYDDIKKREMYNYLFLRIESARRKYNMDDHSADGLIKMANTIKEGKFGNCYDSEFILDP